MTWVGSWRFEGQRADHDFALLETGRQPPSVFAPPRTVETVGHHFHHDHLVTFNLTLRVRPGTKSGGSLTSRHALERAEQLLPRLGELRI